MSTLISPARTAGRRVPRFAEAAVERARLTVVPQRRLAASSAGRTPFAVLMLLTLASGVVGLLMFNTNMQQSSFEATRLQERVSTLTAREQSLTLQLDELRDPQRLAETAKRLGMVPPAQPAFVSLADGRVLGTPTPASPNDAVRINPLPAPKPAALAPKPIVIKVLAPASSRSANSTSARDTAAASPDARPSGDRKKADAPREGRSRTGANR